MGKPTLDGCRTGPEFIKLGKKQANVREGSRHAIIFNDRGQCAVPRHRGDLATGTRCSIVKTLKMMGLTIFLFVVAMIFLCYL